jgi:hypothetical protein
MQMAMQVMSHLFLHTDNDGGCLRDVDAARYTLRQRNGFVRATYGAKGRFSNRRGGLNAGQRMTGVVLKMAPGYDRRQGD